MCVCATGRFKNTNELLNPKALKSSHQNKMHFFQYMGKIFSVEFQRVPLKFHTKYLAHTLKDAIIIEHWNFKSSYVFLKRPPGAGREGYCVEVYFINSLSPGRYGCDFEYLIIVWCNLLIDIFNISSGTVPKWMPQDHFDDWSTMVQVMAWCRQSTGHFLSKCWPRSLASLEHN